MLVNVVVSSMQCRLVMWCRAFICGTSLTSVWSASSTDSHRATTLYTRALVDLIRTLSLAAVKVSDPDTHKHRGRQTPDTQMDYYCTHV